VCSRCAAIHRPSRPGSPTWSAASSVSSPRWCSSARWSLACFSSYSDAKSTSGRTPRQSPTRPRGTPANTALTMNSRVCPRMSPDEATPNGTRRRHPGANLPPDARGVFSCGWLPVCRLLSSTGDVPHGTLVETGVGIDSPGRRGRPWYRLVEVERFVVTPVPRREGTSGSTSRLYN
jgi:hypothetical protein